MTPITADCKILGLSFHKESPELALYDFEQWLIYGVLQTLDMMTGIRFMDYAVPANRITVNYHLPWPERIAELKQLGHQFGCDYILYGSLGTQKTLHHEVDKIQIAFHLFDMQTGEHALQLYYSFNALDNAQQEENPLYPRIEGLQDLITWMAAHLIGAVRPEKSLPIWRKLQQWQLSETIGQYQQLARAHYLQTETALSQKLDLLENIVLQDPNQFLAHLELGFLHRQQRHYHRAITSLEQAFHRMSEVTLQKQGLCATELGICYALIRETAQACEWWKTAIRVHPMGLGAYINLALTLEEEGALSESEHYLLQASEIAPDDSRIYFNLARLYVKQEKWDQAIHQYGLQLILEDNNAWVYSDLANCYLQKGDIKTAKTYLLKTLTLDPDGEAGRCAQYILEGLQAAEV